MGNAKNRNKKVSKKQKGPKKCSTSSAQKENIPKNEKKKVTKTDPDDSIAMSKQLLLKKCKTRIKRGTTSKDEGRICGNGKPLPSLAELEKMYEDSDDDDNQPLRSPKAIATKPCTTPPEKQTPIAPTENKLLSPTTINKISERMMDLISNISDPTELLPDASPPPVIPQKKRKKSDVPYIVGCTERPKVVKKSNTNFCKGDSDYGVDASNVDPEDSPPKKRAKKSNIPTYSKSIFNAKSDEIAEKLAKDDSEGLSDGSSDSSKTIEYDTTSYQSQRTVSFSPLPSTSRDNETFIKNDELFNKSLKEKNICKDMTPEKKENEELDYKGNEIVHREGNEVCDKKGNDVSIIDIPYETIVIDDPMDNNRHLKNEKYDTEISGPIEIDDFPKVITENNIEDECIVVSSNSINSEPIVIDDEYSGINMAMETYSTEPIEIIDIDDIIAENQSILDKLKSKEGENLDKINVVVDVPNTYRNSTSSLTNVSNTLQEKEVIATSNSRENRNTNETNSHNIPNIEQSVSEAIVDLSTNEINDSTPNAETENAIEEIVSNFFQSNQNRRNKHSHASKRDPNIIRTLFDTLLSSITTIMPSSSQVNNNNVTNTIITPRLQDNISNQSIQPAQPLSISSEQNITHSSTITPSRNLGDCPICMDPLSINGIASTICGHVFCLKCIQAAIKANGKKCPTCRKALKGAGGGYHQLYL